MEDREGERERDREKERGEEDICERWKTGKEREKERGEEGKGGHLWKMEEVRQEAR